MNDIYFKYGQEEVDWLKRHDPALGCYIDCRGYLPIKVFPDLFTCFIWAIAGQQISGKVHATIWQRLFANQVRLDPVQYAKENPESLKKSGISTRKAEYMINFAQKFLALAPDENKLKKMGSKEFSLYFRNIKGIGPWTQEMVLIFGLQDKNIISFKDLAIKRALMRLHGLKTLTENKFIDLTKKYTPYASIASFYLWDLNSRGLYQTKIQE